MAIKAYVLINLITMDPAKTISDLKKIGEVKSADAVIGPYDAIAIIEAPSMDILGKVVVEKMLKVEGISKTLTCVRL